MKNKILSSLKIGGGLIAILVALGILIWFIASGLSSQETGKWLEKPLSKLNIGDLLLIVVVSSLFLRSEVNCNCNKNK